MTLSRILITGNMGYVGPGVVRLLRQAFPTAELIGYDLGFFAHCLTGTLRLPETRLDRQLFGDVRTLPAGLLAGVDAVVHLAAISNDPMGKAYEDVTMEVNHQAGIVLARRAKACGVKTFVFASSCSMYGLGGDGAKDESSSLNPLTAYARSKVASERDLAPLADANFRVSCLRFATACGWSDRLRLDLVLNDFVAGAVATGEVSILSDGTPWRPLIHDNAQCRVPATARAIPQLTHVDLDLDRRWSRRFCSAPPDGEPFLLYLCNSCCSLYGLGGNPSFLSYLSTFQGLDRLGLRQGIS